MLKIAINKPGNSVLVGTLVPVGSRDEMDSVKGVSHFVEHFLFKGTKTRSKDDITRTVEQYGAEFNAWTSEEHTFYYMTIASRYRDLARTIIDDMVHNSVFPSEEVDNERDVIMQELQMYDDNPQSRVFQIAQSAMFNKTSGLHIPIIGTPTTLNDITQKTLISHYAKYYKQMVQVEVGDVKNERNRIITPKRFDKEPLNTGLNDLIVSQAEINQANMVMTGLFYNNNAEDDRSLQLLSSVLNGFQGRLFQTIREKNHLVYHCSFMPQKFSCGTVQYWVYAALNPDKIQQAKQLIIDELTRPVTDTEYIFAKSKHIGQQALDLDKNSYVIKTIIDSVINNEAYEDALTNYDKGIVSLSQLNAFMSKINFKNSKLVAIIPE